MPHQWWGQPLPVSFSALAGTPARAGPAGNVGLTAWGSCSLPWSHAMANRTWLRYRVAGCRPSSCRDTALPCMASGLAMENQALLKPLLELSCSRGCLPNLGQVKVGRGWAGVNIKGGLHATWRLKETQKKPEIDLGFPDT